MARLHPDNQRSMILRRNRIARCSAMLMLSLCGCSGSSELQSPAIIWNLDDEELNLLEVTENKALVIIFMRTDCPIGNRYAPKISELVAEFQSADLQFALVYPNARESAAKIQRHLKDYSLDLKAYRDPRRQLVEQTHATVTPEAVVYDRQHRLIYRGRIDDRFMDFGKARPKPTKNDLRDVLSALRQRRKIKPTYTNAIGCYIEEKNEK